MEKRALQAHVAELGDTGRRALAEPNPAPTAAVLAALAENAAVDMGQQDAKIATLQVNSIILFGFSSHQDFCLALARLGLRGYLPNSEMQVQ